MENHASPPQPVLEKPQPLFHRNFTLVVLGQIISLFGNAILRFALPLYILSESGSPALFGVVSALAFIPMVIVSPIGGIIADRVNKQRIMVVLDFVTAGIILAFIFLSGNVAMVPLIVVVMMLLYSIQGLYSPAVQASLPLLAKGDNLVPANAVVNLVQSFSSLIGPVIGGLLFAAYGLGPIMIVSCCCFAFSAIMELFIVIPHTHRPDSRGALTIALDDITQSYRFLRREKPVLLKGTLIVFAFNLFLSSMIMVGLPVIITEYLGVSYELFGVSQALLAAGGLAGGLAAGLLAKRLSIKRCHILLFLSACSILPMGLTILLNAPAIISFWIISAMSFLMMACATLFSIQMLAFVQEQTPTEFVGKVISLVMAIAICAQPLGQALYGMLFEACFSIPWVILLGAAAISGIVALYSKRTFTKLDTNPY